MLKKIFFSLVIISSYSNIFCFNPKNENLKCMFATMAWGTGITATWALLAVIPDKESSLQEKIGLVAFSTFFAGALSGLMGKINLMTPLPTHLKKEDQRAVRMKDAKITGIMCGLAIPVLACITYYQGQDPRNIRNLLTTGISLENIYR